MISIDIYKHSFKPCHTENLLKFGRKGIIIFFYLELTNSFCRLSNLSLNHSWALFRWLEISRDSSRTSARRFSAAAFICSISSSFFLDSWNRRAFEPPHDKTNKMVCAPSKDSDQPGHLPSLIRVFPVHMKKAWVLSYPLSATNDSDQTGWMSRLIWVFAGVTVILLVLSLGGSFICLRNKLFLTMYYRWLT